MITDIHTIKKELKGFSQIELPYDIKHMCPIKYLTIKDNKEAFYTGGNFVRFGNECIILTKSNKNWSVKNFIKDKNGNILYSSKYFIPDDDDTLVIPDNKSFKELKSIIKSQQHIIDKLSQKIKELST